MKHEEIIEKMSLEDKIAFCSGKSFWETKAFERYDIPSLFLSDGPHGLRKQVGEVDHLGLNASIKTTCFPTASALASTWDIELLYKVGEALGEEAVKEDVNVILGPGVNMKRNPLCGRNFEYFSEDPFLSGKMASAWIKGVQSKGVGVSLKHFALNNQEKNRMSTNVLVDERALREYYLPAFEMAVKEAVPTTLMCAYNKVEGIYCSDSKRLLWDILRHEWGFEGVVITDWAAMNDRIKAFKAGVDLEMPGSRGRFDREVKQAVENGNLDESYIDLSVDRLLTLIERTTSGNKLNLDKDLYERHHELARKVAVSGGILLKNENKILPFKDGSRITVIGELAQIPRYQGNGSSLVKPTKVYSLLDGVREYTKNVNYVQGYTIEDMENEMLIKEAVRAVKNEETVLLCIGLTDSYESEAYDRDHMKISGNQTRLINAVLEANKKVVVVVVGGSAIEMPWADKAQAILHMQLSGQAGGVATADLLFGKENPSGKLTEVYPLKYEDVVSSSYFTKTPKLGVYFESVYCGYRYFETANIPVRYPFGFGMSYTEFEYSDIKVNRTDKYNFEVLFMIKNIGDFDGGEVAQLYVVPHTEGVYRPIKELKGFAKINLNRGETKQVSIKLNKRSFAFYDIYKKDWVVEKGIYIIQIGSSSKNIRLQRKIELEGLEPVRSNCAKWYYSLNGTPTKGDFATIHHDYTDPMPKTKGSYDMNSSIREMKETSLLCRIIYKIIEKIIAKSIGGRVDYRNPNFRIFMDGAADNPMKSMSLFSPKFVPVNLAEFVVDIANGHVLKALGKFLRYKR